MVRAILSFTAILGFFLQCNVARSAPRDVEYAVYRCIDQHRNPTVSLGPVLLCASIIVKLELQV
jgi:hypothetical protein